MTRNGYSDEDLLSLSGIQHFYFCRRQWALIHLEQQWKENLRTTQGHFLHERVDDPYFNETRGISVISRAFPVVSYNLGFYGIADVVEFLKSDEGVSLPGHEGFWRINPVEYKRGSPKVDERDEVQVCAQAICLEEMFDTRVDSGDLYYYETRRRVTVDNTDYLRDLVFSLSKEMHEIYSSGLTPPAVKNKNCRSCSLYDLCVPNLTKKKISVGNYIKKHVKEAVDTGNSD
ncbi:CRISPR-associated protein Cas4 [Methanolacinia paynteri]|uniref:CRISPR-associated protein Cas4 n=1 Tax=Methanolacinia paynteri TaxID=230356 RepID=UPI00064EDEA9|nr:CRISPR-associated protein Cas4 [Methanolacinia paynteri]